MKPWHLYLVRTADGALYTGIAIDVDRRFSEHCAGGAKASKFLRPRGPLELVYRLEIGDHSTALKTEALLKALSKAGKESIAAEQPDRERLLEILAIVTHQE